MRRKLLFFGDSNTYGYDPANYYTLRYPEEQRWTTMLARSAARRWELIPEGLNGRALPRLPGDAPLLRSLLDRLGPEDVFAVMLGTNDLLGTWPPDAQRAVERMDALLRFLLEEGRDAGTVLVIAPPCLDKLAAVMPSAGRCGPESHRMNQGFRDLAGRWGVRFADAGTWDIDLCGGDWVHFSEAGHRQFARRMEEVLERL